MCPVAPTLGGTWIFANLRSRYIQLTVLIDPFVVFSNFTRK